MLIWHQDWAGDVRVSAGRAYPAKAGVWEGGARDEGQGGRGKGLITDVIDAINDVTEPKLIKHALVCQFWRIIGD